MSTGLAGFRDERLLLGAGAWTSPRRRQGLAQPRAPPPPSRLPGGDNNGVPPGPSAAARLCSPARGQRADSAGAPEDKPRRPADHRFSWQLKPEPRVAWCDLCAGLGVIECERCHGRGKVHTKPGNAGVAFKVGVARCSECLGQAVIPCPLCTGVECKVRVDLLDPLCGVKPDFSNFGEWIEEKLAEAPEGSNLGPQLGREAKRRWRQKKGKGDEPQDGGG